jgi:hypothetical protein
MATAAGAGAEGCLFEMSTGAKLGGVASIGAAMPLARRRKSAMALRMHVSVLRGAMVLNVM